MLDYGEAEAGAAGLARVAFVDAVEALEDAALRLGRDAHAVVGDGEAHAAVGQGAHADVGPAALGPGIFDRVLGEVPDYLPEQAAHAADRSALAGDREGDLSPLRLVGERGRDLAGHGHEVGVLARELLALVEAGEVYHVLHQLDEARGLAAYPAQEAVAVLGAHEPVLQELRRAHYRVQRRLELVRDVGGELAPEPLGALLFRHIDGQQHGALPLPARDDGAGGEQVFALAAAYAALGAPAAGALFKQGAKLRAAVHGQDVAPLAGGVRAEDFPRAGVDAHHRAPAVYEDKALAHGIGYGGELLLAAAQLLKLAAYLPLLPLQAGEQRAELVVYVVLKGLVEVDGVEGADDALRKPAGQPAGENQRQHEDKDQRLDYPHEQRGQGVVRLRRAQHAPVREAYRVVHRLLREGGAGALALARAVAERLAELLALGVVLHLAGLGVGVVYDRAVLGNPGQAHLAVVDRLEVFKPGALHAVGREPGLNVQLPGLPDGKVVVHRAHDEGQPGQEDQQAGEEDASEDSLCHGCASIR